MQISPSDVPPLLFVGIAAFAGIVWMFCWMIVSTSRTREKERTRREIAAYVAEGSISPEDAERLLADNTAAAEREKTRRQITESVAGGSLSAEDAERLLTADMPVWERGEAWGCGNRRPRTSPPKHQNSNGTPEVARG